MIDELLVYDEMSQMFFDAWSGFDWSNLTAQDEPIVIFEGMANPIPPADKAWVRFTVNPVETDQASLSGANNIKKWETIGIINVQSFAPLTWDNAYHVSEYMSIMAKRVFQGKASPNGITFDKCSTNRIGPDGGWYQFNTLIQYKYHEQR